MRWHGYCFFCFKDCPGFGQRFFFLALWWVGRVVTGVPKHSQWVGRAACVRGTVKRLHQWGCPGAWGRGGMALLAGSVVQCVPVTGLSSRGYSVPPRDGEPKPLPLTGPSCATSCEPPASSPPILLRFRERVISAEVGVQAGRDFTNSCEHVNNS